MKFSEAAYYVLRFTNNVLFFVFAVMAGLYLKGAEPDDAPPPPAVGTPAQYFAHSRATPDPGMVAAVRREDGRVTLITWSNAMGKWVERGPVPRDANPDPEDSKGLGGPFWREVPHE